MLSEVDSEVTEGLGHPAGLGDLKAEAGRVDERDDRHRSAAIGQINAADAAIVLDLDTEIVLVGDRLAVSGGLHTSHHELVLWGDILLHTLLLLRLSDIVLDLRQIKGQSGAPVAITSIGSHNALLHKPVGVGVRVVLSLHGKALLNKELDGLDLELASLVVDLNLALAVLIGQKHILVEDTAHGRVALVNTAPGLDVAGLRLSVTLAESDGLLSDDEDLLEFHLVVLVMSVENGLNVVLDLGLGLFAGVLVLEGEGGRELVGEVRRELHRVDARVQHATLDVEDVTLVFKELLAVLELVGVVDSARLITMLLRRGVMTDERGLLLTLELEGDVGGHDRLHDLEVDDTLYGVAWLVEGVLRLQLDLSLGETGSGIFEEKGHP